MKVVQILITIAITSYWFGVWQESVPAGLTLAGIIISIFAISRRK